MYQDAPSMNLVSPGWRFFSRVTFVVSIAATTVGIVFLPADIWVKGFLCIGLYFSIGSTFTLSKTLRDEFESTRLINRLSEAKSEKLLSEFEKGKD